MPNEPFNNLKEAPRAMNIPNTILQVWSSHSHSHGVVVHTNLH
jgi:hypothetical protein